MKTMFIKSLLMAGLIGAVPVHSYATAGSSDADKVNELIGTVNGDITIDSDDEGCIYVTSEYVIDDGADDGEESTNTSTLTMNDDGTYEMTVTDENGNEQTFTYSSIDEINELIGTVDGDITIDSDDEDCIYVTSEYVIDDGVDDGIENNCTYTMTE